ncbi:uncharacterized protein N7515_000358 [Penicillium bovifimosum]|uniref:Uncharacterized protein n=1 Tax=Penicillium bovifimosum TaxID=126998 RepID=A0A9W9L9U1_9EURO|nr:uncharacterized protein N7515_000358 [Penicillium bovifimosum]KAJ5145794.1 hypothetical protein N7515_000358 [Penicillium bovifimosum]
MAKITFGSLDPRSSSPARGSPFVHEEAQEEQPVSKFKERHGPGFKLTTERSARNVFVHSSTQTRPVATLHISMTAFMLP